MEPAGVHELIEQFDRLSRLPGPSEPPADAPDLTRPFEALRNALVQRPSKKPVASTDIDVLAPILDLFSSPKEHPDQRLDQAFHATVEVASDNDKAFWQRAFGDGAASSRLRRDDVHSYHRRRDKSTKELAGLLAHAARDRLKAMADERLVGVAQGALPDSEVAADTQSNVSEGSTNVGTQVVEPDPSSSEDRLSAFSVDGRSGQMTNESVGHTTAPQRQRSRPRSRLAKRRALIASVAVLVLVSAALLSWLGVSLATGSNINHAIGRSKSFASAYCPPETARPKAKHGTVFVTVQQEPASADHCWTPLLSPVEPGSTLKYLLTYENTSNTVQRNVVIGFNLAPKLLLVPNSTLIANSNYPKGTPDHSNNIASGGINIGNYGPRAGAFVQFKVVVPYTGSLSCGTNDFRSVGIVRPSGLGNFYNTAELQVFGKC